MPRPGAALAAAFSIVLPLLATAQAPAPPAADALAGTSWKALELAGMTVPAQPPGREPHLVFVAGGRVSGADGCNRLTGSYAVKGEALTFGQIASTQMACPDAEEVPRRFHGALKGTSRWRLAGDRLEFYGATGKPLAVFARREAPPAGGAPPLQGTSWQLVRFQGGDDTVLTPDDRTKYTLQFEAEGRIAARLDCNRGRGTWKATTAGQLELGPLALTRAMCPPGSLHDHFVKQWAAIRSYLITDGHLFLSLMADGGIYEFEPMTPARP
jgi:heat shock protein HslJ